jgi:hypothetical protein
MRRQIITWALFVLSVPLAFAAFLCPANSLCGALAGAGFICSFLGFLFSFFEPSRKAMQHIILVSLSALFGFIAMLSSPTSGVGWLAFGLYLATFGAWCCLVFEIKVPKLRSKKS